MDRINYHELASQARTDGMEQFAVGAVIKINDKFLLLERNPDDFLGGLVEIPGGKIDQNESIEDALIREVLEETSLTVTKIIKYLESFDYLSGTSKKTRIFNFLVQTAEDKIKINPDEHINFFLKNYDEIIKERLNISNECMKIIETADRLK